MWEVTQVNQNDLGLWAIFGSDDKDARRSVPVPASVVKALASYKSKQARARLNVGQEYQDNDLVFATTHGTPLMRRNLVRRHFKPILKDAKLDKSIRLYDLRHTCATLLLAANENPKVVSERLGHASIAITMDTYSHVLPSMQRAASDKLESMPYKKPRHTGGTQKKAGKELLVEPRGIEPLTS